MNSYLLSCSISANVRQSIQIKFDDLKLPASVITTLERQNTVSLRPNLSNALKGELDDLRVLQRELYDNYCLHFGDTHFVTAKYFDGANDIIARIRAQAGIANEKLYKIWEQEFSKWNQTVEEFLRPLFPTDEEYKLACDAYMRVFPTQEEYRNPIRVFVVGPLPISLEAISTPVEGAPFDSVLAHSNYINTKEVLDAAHASAADRALQISAELLDDLDTRTVTKIGRQQTGGDKKRGSWEITAAKLKLISDSVSGFDHLSELSEKLLIAGDAIQSAYRTERDQGAVTFQELQTEIRTELESIVSTRDKTKGLEMLQQSLALSNTYKSLCDRIKKVENTNALNLLISESNIEQDIYRQRSKQLNKLISQRRELIGAAGENLDTLISTVATTAEDSETLDF